MVRRSMLAVVVMAAALTFVGGTPVGDGPALAQACSPAYPDFCIPPPPPDINCTDPEIGGRVNFTALPPDPHDLDGNDNDGLACEDPTRPRFTTTTVPPVQPAPSTTTVQTVPPDPLAAPVTTTTTVLTVYLDPPTTTTTVQPTQPIRTGVLDRTG